MVASCLPGAKKDIVDLCLRGDNSSLQSMTPVFAADNYLYKNPFCASCNFVHEFRLALVGAKCVDNYCHFFISKLENKHAYLRRCKEGSVYNKQCHVNSTFYGLCHSYTASFAGYANYHCWRCNNENITGSSLVNKCKTLTIRNKFNPMLSWSALFSYSYLNWPERSYMDIKQSKDNPITTTTVYCERGTIFDFIQNKCNKFVCAAGYEETDYKCVRKAGYTKRPISEFINLNITNFDKCLLAMEPSIFVLHNVLNTSIFCHTESSALNISCEAFVNVYKNMNVTIEQGDINSIGSLWKQIFPPSKAFLEFLAIIKELVITSFYPLLTQRSTIDISLSLPGDKRCAEEVALDINLVTFTSNCNILFKGELMEARNITMLITMNKYKASRYISLCKNFYLQSDCLLQRLISNVTIDENSNLIYRGMEGNKTYLPYEYIPLTYGFGVCANHPRKQETELFWEDTVRVLEGYISVIGTSVSLVFHMITILTFAYFKQLWIVPMLGVLTLCICLFISDALFLTASILVATECIVTPAVCEGIAILIHFGLLCAQVCTVLLAVNIALQFKKLQFSTRRRRITMMEYHRRRIYVFLLPLLTTIIAVSLDKKGVIEVGYGDNGVCVFNGFYGRLVFFIIPTAISLVISILLLFYTMRKISADMRNNESLRNSGAQQIRTTLIALKLTVALGIVEGVGFMQFPRISLKESEKIVNIIFGVLHTLFRSFRGVILFTIFVCRKELVNAWRNGDKGQRRVTPNTPVSQQTTESGTIASLSKEKVKNNQAPHYNTIGKPVSQQKTESCVIASSSKDKFENNQVLHSHTTGIPVSQQITDSCAIALSSKENVENNQVPHCHTSGKPVSHQITESCAIASSSKENVENNQVPHCHTTGKPVSQQSTESNTIVSPSKEKVKNNQAPHYHTIGKPVSQQKTESCLIGSSNKEKVENNQVLHPHTTGNPVSQKITEGCAIASSSKANVENNQVPHCHTSGKPVAQQITESGAIVSSSIIKGYAENTASNTI
jgi:uncharacterized membrane protein